ncbi:FAD-dependent oxidoreductase [Microdochium nivale]|nr:FAD-dependent oxidoreductase [Microdochium nivale]
MSQYRAFSTTRVLAITALAILLVQVQARASDESDPGYPVQNPTISYWQIPTHPDVADHQSAGLPETADIVIIGSGMSGTSVAWHLLVGDDETDSGASAGHTATASRPRIAMLEARQACSGATGRNGGHIRPSSYEEYDAAKKVTTQEEAIKITTLRANHTQAILAAASKLPAHAREWSSARRVDSLDVFFDEKEFRHAVHLTEILKQEVPDVGDQWEILERDEAVRISLMPSAVGALAGTPELAGAVWGYRFVTGSLKFMLDGFPVAGRRTDGDGGSFSLDTHTPARQVRTLPAGSEYNFEVITDRGVIRTDHVVHASNAWVPRFTVGMGGFLDSWILHMSAQFGGTGLPNVGKWPPHHSNISLPSGRAWSLFRSSGLDYVVQQPENNEFMFGGGAGLGSAQAPLPPGLKHADNATTMSPVYEAYLGGALPTYFGYEGYGAERCDDHRHLEAGPGAPIWPGRTKRVWNGIEALTGDALPIVGPLDERFSNRSILADPSRGQEWVTTGFNGEGMAYTWLAGKGLGEMIRGHHHRHDAIGKRSVADVSGGDDPVFEWFPRAFLLTEERIKKAAELSARQVRGLRRRAH